MTHSGDDSPDFLQSDDLGMFPFEAVELLCSRLCHDLISPVSAINNGIELLNEEDVEIQGEALELVGKCSGEASSKLQFFRAAYGRGGGSEGIFDLSDIRKLSAAYFAPTPARLVWGDENLVATQPFPKLSVKLILNMLLLARDALPLGGEIIFRLQPKAMGLWGECAAVGPRIKFSDEIKAALEGNLSADELTPETIQAYLAGRLSGFAGSGLQVVPTQAASAGGEETLMLTAQLS